MKQYTLNCGTFPWSSISSRVRSARRASTSPRLNSILSCRPTDRLGISACNIESRMPSMEPVSPGISMAQPCVLGCGGASVLPPLHFPPLSEAVSLLPHARAPDRTCQHPVFNPRSLLSLPQAGDAVVPCCVREQGVPGGRVWGRRGCSDTRARGWYGSSVAPSLAGRPPQRDRDGSLRWSWDEVEAADSGPYCRRAAKRVV